jgi:hypothetical protein
MEDTPTCHICGSPDHIARDCSDPRNRNTPKQQKLQKLYNQFRPAQHRRPRKSYANAANNARNNGKNPQPGIAQEELPNILQAIQLLTNKIVSFEQQMSNIDKELANQRKLILTQPQQLQQNNITPQNNINANINNKQKPPNVQQHTSHPSKRQRPYNSSSSEAERPAATSSSSHARDRSSSPALIQIEQQQSALKGDVDEMKNILSNLNDTITRATSPQYQTDEMDDDYMEDYNENEEEVIYDNEKDLYEKTHI